MAVTSVLPPSIDRMKNEKVAHCVIVLGCLIYAKKHGINVSDHDAVFHGVYGKYKETYTDAAEIAYNHYKDKEIAELEHSEWVLATCYYGKVGKIRGDKCCYEAFNELMNARTRREQEARKEAAHQRHEEFESLKATHGEEYARRIVYNGRKITYMGGEEWAF
jgi:hypothetical protein